MIYTVPDGMPLSVFNSKYSRRDPVTGAYQTWEERISEVIDGNFRLDPRHNSYSFDEYKDTMRLGKEGIFATSGRHLQHGDFNQPSKQLEFFSNCSSSAFSFQKFHLMLRGSGVGRDYSNASCRTDWSYMPDIRLVLDEAHPDFNQTVTFTDAAGEKHTTTVQRAMFKGGIFESLREAKEKYESESEEVRWFTIPDSREGWAQAVAILETAAFHKTSADKLFIFDCSLIRPSGSPIKGLQGRPASGPIPLMNALAAVYTVKSAKMKPWKQNLFVDHYTSACVQLGGARRAARMATKSWRDPYADLMDFIDTKRKGLLWSANNSILVDAEFWKEAAEPRHTKARRIFEAMTNAAYYDKTGEPGFINVDMLTANSEGLEHITGATCIDPTVFDDLHPKTVEMIDNVLGHLKKQPYHMITNPCGEIPLSLWGGYCVIGDINLARVTKLEDALSAVALMSKFLIRANLMRAEYSAETKRTNRIGVCLTGIHEFAWNLFGMTFKDMINPDGDPTGPFFWKFIDDLRNAAENAAAEYAKEIGVNVPHTVTAIKPSGTISKVLNCTEGAHLPARAFYLRWVQYGVDDPALAQLREQGYPTKDVSHRYTGHHVVGFPTCQPLAELMGEHVATADETSMEDHFRWLNLLEKHWLGPVGRNNQISYTLAVNTEKTSFEEFQAAILKWQPTVRCCTVMPVSDWRESEKTYSYVPEQPITQEEYNRYMSVIKNTVSIEKFTDDELACAGGACPIELNIN